MSDKMNLSEPDKLVLKLGNGGGRTIQSDHAQNDPSKPDHIKNRLAYYCRKFEDIEVVERLEPIIATLTNEEGSPTPLMIKFSDLPEKTKPTEIVKELIGLRFDGEEILFDDPEMFPPDLSTTLTHKEFPDEKGHLIGASLDMMGEIFVIAVNTDDVVWHYPYVYEDDGNIIEKTLSIHFPEKGMYGYIMHTEKDESGTDVRYYTFDKFLFKYVERLNKDFIPKDYVTSDEIPSIPTKLSELNDDETHRTVTDSEKESWNAKPEKGDDGLSAYEIAVKNGFEGSEEEWLESLKGEGETGDISKLETVASAFDFNFNLFDKSTATAGSYIDGTEIKSNAAYCVSAYIEIKPLTYYIVPSILNNLGSEFDENKAFLKKITRSDISQPDSDKTLIYTGSKAKYIRVNIFVGPGTPENVRDINTFMVLEGTEYPETFIPHNGLKPILKPDCIIDEEATDTGEIEKVINAFDFNFNLFDKDAATVGSYAVRENIVNNSSYYVSDYIEVKPLTYYVVPNTASQVGSCFDENKTYLGQLKRSALSPQPYSDKTVIVTTATTKYIRVNGFSGVADAFVTCPINEYMVIEGQAYPENYIPYNGLKPLIKPDCIPENKELVNKVNRSNILYGKTLMTIGDSITRGLMIDVSEETGYKMTYGGLTACRNNMTFINLGWNGGTIANDNEDPFINNGNINVDLGDITPDYLTIWYGWNDYTHKAILLGDIDSTDETTYYGAWNIALNLLINKYPTTKIGVVVPYGMDAEWRQAVRDVAKKWGVPYLDLYENQSCIFDNEYGVEPSIAGLRKATFLADHCHPNSAGYEWLSTMYEAFLRRL